MDSERWRRIEAVFEGALELAPEHRDEFVIRECGEDGNLREQVLRMLDADGDGSALDSFSPAGCTSALGFTDPIVGSEVGAWRIDERIAAGGMGVVYRAHRADGEFDQTVAIKLLRADLSDERVAFRFRNERQTLAALEHPGIARLVDGGAAPDGRPFLVMEFVDGTRLDDHCRDLDLDLDERLDLLAQVCDVVQWAHSQLVVHRDLKPSNILVDRSGRPRLVDFGIARLVGPERNFATRTQLGHSTPEYASPEQLAGRAPSVRDDVYSLGVVAYELVTGERPFRRAEDDPLRFYQDVAETEAQPASSRVRDRDTALARRLRGDVDLILAAALRKDPDRRYATVAELADDLKRHREGLPIRARGESSWYRLRCLVARNRVAAAGLAISLIALVIGLVVTIDSERRADLQAQHASIEAESSQEFADFLLETFLVGIDPEDIDEVEARSDQIDQRARRIRVQYSDQPHQRANLLDSLGQTASRLGFVDLARTLCEESLAIREETFGAEDIECSRSLLNLGRLDYSIGNFEAATAALERGLAIQRATPRGPHSNPAAFANDLAACCRATGDLDRAEALLLEALAVREADDPDSLPVAETLNNLASVASNRGAFEQAAPLLERSHAIRRRVLGEDDLLTIQSLSNRAVIARRLGDDEAAESFLQQAEDGYRRLGRAGMDGLAQVLHNRGWVAAKDGQLEDAVARLEEAEHIHGQILPTGHPRQVNTLRELVAVLTGLGRGRDACEVQARLVDSLVMAPLPDESHLQSALVDLAARHLALGESSDAERCLLRAVGLTGVSDDSPTSVRARTMLEELSR